MSHSFCFLNCILSSKSYPCAYICSLTFKTKKKSLSIFEGNLRGSVGKRTEMSPPGENI